MTDLRDGLEHEIRRHRLPSDALERVAEHKRRRQRNRRLASGLVALVVAGAGIGGGLYAVRSTGPGAPGAPPGRTTLSPVAPSPVESPSQPAAPAVSTIPFVSGPIQFVDANRGWMAGAAGEILSTNDGGHAWTA